MTSLPRFLFESGYKFSVPLDANVSVEVVVRRKSNTIRNSPSTVLQCPVGLTSLRGDTVVTSLPSFCLRVATKFSVALDANVSVEVVVTRKSNTIRNFPCTIYKVNKCSLKELKNRTRESACHRLFGLVVRRPLRERKVPGSNPACDWFFSGSSHTSDLNIGTPVATLPGAWRYRVSTGTGRPGVSIL